MHNVFLFTVGMVSVSLMPILPPITIILSLFFLAIYCTWKHYVTLACLFLGILAGLFQAYITINSQLPEELENTPLKVTGIIAGIPVVESKKIQFLFDIEEIYLPGKKSKKTYKVKLNYYISNDDIRNKKITFYPGQRWSFYIKLKRPRGFVNPSGFDYQAYLISKGVSATGYILAKHTIQKNNDFSGNSVIQYWRWKLLNKLQDLSKDNKTFPYIAGLLVGEKQWFTDEQWQLLHQTGTIHLIAISGLHIGLAAVIGFLAGKLFSRFMTFCAPFMTIRPNSIEILCSLLFAMAYGLLAGMTLPTQRALAMLLCFYLIIYLYRYISPFSVLSLAFLIVAIADSFIIYSQGFWLSFGAVFILLYGFYGRVNEFSSNKFLLYLVTLIKTQYILFAGLFVIYGYWFSTINFISPIANLVAVPLISFVVIPLLFLVLAFLLLEHFFSLQIAAFIIDILLSMIEAGLELFENILHFSLYLFNGFNYPFPEKSNYFLLIAVLFSFLLFLSPKGFYGKGLLFVFLSVLVLPKENNFNLRLTLLDAGQGTAVVIETKNHTMVYDTGRQFGQRFSTGKHIIAPYLYMLGKRSIDKLMITHSDNDHAGGLQGLLEEIDVIEISGGQPDLSNVPMKQCKADQKWQWDSVNFHVLWPSSHALSNPEVPLNDNNYSCVLLLQVDNQTVLLSGDIEASVEKRLLTTEPLISGIDIDVMLVPHHGSKTSSSHAWVNQLQPSWAVVTAGYRNPYNHPHPDIVQRYRNIGSKIFNTATDGAIRITWRSGKEPEIERWRLNYSRYWYSSY